MTQDMNPAAVPFQPGYNRDGLGNQLPQSAFGDPPQYENSAQRAYADHAAQLRYQAAYQRWVQYYGYQGYHPDFYSAAPAYNQPYGQFYPNPAPPFQYGQHTQQNYPSHALYSPASPFLSDLPYRGTNAELQYALGALVGKLKSKTRKPDTTHRAFPPPSMEFQSEAAIGAQTKPKEYGSLQSFIPSAVASARINKSCRNLAAPKAQPQASQKKGRYGDHKIMLPAPMPTPEYFHQAAEEPFSIGDRPGHILVILDLNGTLLFRPNKNPKVMIERPFLKPFLRFLFENFSVMIWSSAKPDNVKSLVMQSLDKKSQSKLVARWARESFGLSPAYYSQNVQVYKNLKLVWSRDVIQQHHPEYAAGGRFGQHNTVLIDDTVIKASAQPHNLLEIPEFSATAEQMRDNVLQEVAGYLEELKRQGDVSRFISKKPFQVGMWSFQFPDGGSNGDGIKVEASIEENASMNIVGGVSK